MAISTLVYVDKIPDKHRRQILGVFSSEINAWRMLRQKIGHPPYTDGIFRFKDEEGFLLALQDKTGAATAILLYSDVRFDITLHWDVIDKPF